MRLKPRWYGDRKLAQRGESADGIGQDSTPTTSDVSVRKFGSGGYCLPSNASAIAEERALQLQEELRGDVSVASVANPIAPAFPPSKKGNVSFGNPFAMSGAEWRWPKQSTP